ncbi:MAG: alanine dehydrogenase [Archaeoglobaceae archaeon]
MEVVWLKGDDVKKVLEMGEVIESVETAFRYYGLGRVQMPSKSYLYFSKYNGDLRTMPAYIPDTDEAGVKIVNSHPQNPSKGLPTVLAIYVLNDPATGKPLAMMNATYLTDIRTGAGSAVATKYLARGDSRVMGIVGCGRQSRTQLSAISELFDLEEVLITDKSGEQCDLFIKEMENKIDADIKRVDLQEACRADIITTTTPVKEPIINSEWIEEGTHINAVGADAPGKQELGADILKRARIVVDSREQAFHSGEINVPLSRGEISKEDVYAELGEIVASKKPGREGDEEVTVFDSTGMAVQDVAVAALAYQKAVEKNMGTRLEY